jgi:hypothetical protein
MVELQKVPCPKCKKDVNVVKIVYGLPRKELAQRIKRGEVVSGGCMMSDDSPLYACKECHISLPEYGTHKDLKFVEDKDAAKAFVEKEKGLLGESTVEKYLKEIGFL